MCYVLILKFPHKIKVFENIVGLMFYIRNIDKKSILCIVRDGKDVTKDFI